ncbi:MAG: hypothetical protein HEP71_13060 [Roseivirga sp.]|nr:hypothetical protein [Roseivirga sp.]
MSTTPNVTDWKLSDLQNHLAMAIDLEFWTIPFYRVAYHSLDSSHSAARTAIDEVSQQEMYHCQCAWNIAQAFGTSYDFTKRTFAYEGTTIPHLDFSLESPNPATTGVTIGGNSYNFSNYSAKLDASTFAERINAMCLVEYPDWAAPTSQELKPNISEYPSIGHFYGAIKTLLNETTPQAFSNGDLVSDSITGGGTSQTALFTGLAPAGEKVTSSGTAGMAQINALINAIVEEGEGTSSSPGSVPAAYQFDNTTDPHFDSFLTVYNDGLTQKTMNSGGAANIMAALPTFLTALQAQFESGGNSSGFMGAMYAFDGVISSQFS